MKIKQESVFIDTNVWFSAFYKEGVCSKLLRLIASCKLRVVVSELILEEILRNVKIKIPDALPLVVEYLQKIQVIVVKNPSKSSLFRYKSFAKFHDLPILMAAIGYRCHYFVTGNKKDFKTTLIKNKTGLQVETINHFNPIRKSHRSLW